MEQENRLKITVWLKPDVVQRMDGWLKADNCKSRGEFTEKALRFYMGYLATEDTSELARSRNFPAMLVGSRIVVPKDRLLAWVERKVAERI